MQNRWKKEERKFDARKRDEDVFKKKKKEKGKPKKEEMKGN